MQRGKPMGLSFAHILILVLVLVLLFGRGKISEVMGDLAKGLKSFKQNMQEEETPVTPSKTLELESDRRPVSTAAKEEHKVG
jgi:sec-independent protein translocase protein TatA